MEVREGLCAHRSSSLQTVSSWGLLSAQGQCHAGTGLGPIVPHRKLYIETHLPVNCVDLF